LPCFNFVFQFSSTFINPSGVIMTLFKLSAITMAVASLAACQTISSVGSSVAGMGQKAGNAVSQTAGAATQKAGSATSQRAGTSQATSQATGQRTGYNVRAGGSQQAVVAPVTFATTGLRNTTVESGAEAGYPPARVGECYARVIVPASTGTVSERVLKRAASSKVEIVPAVYSDGEERIMVRAESKQLQVIPAVYQDATERVMVRPASKQLISTPATYKTATERRLVTPATSVWKRSSELTIAERALQNVDSRAGDVLCLVEVPAVYQDVVTQVIDQPGTSREVDVPAEYTTVVKSVVLTPATTREIVIPAEYRTVKTSKVATPAREVRTDIPAEYDTITKTVTTAAARNEWRQIVCETNATPAKLAEIQNALTRAGFATGRTDGIIDNGTLAAVRKFQEARGLPVDYDRYINVATVRTLGVAEK
jgi:Putative peptidoglycan binding domain